MKQITGFIKKEFFHIFRDVRSMIILFGIPVIQIILFGFVLTNEIREVPFVFVDNSHDSFSSGLIRKIESSKYFSLKSEIYDAKVIDREFKDNNIKMAIIIGENASVSLLNGVSPDIQLITDATDPNTAKLISMYTSVIIQGYFTDFMNLHAAKQMITPQVRMLYNEDLEGAFMFVPGIVAVIMMLISALMTSITLAREKELGTMEILLASPLKPRFIILGKIIPYLVLALVDAIMVMIIGNYIFGVPIRGSIIVLFLLILIYLSVSLSLGVLVSAFAPTQMVAMFLSGFALMMPTMLLSGFIFPIENMPVVLQYLSALMPPRWFIDAIRKVMLKGSTFIEILKPVFILIVMNVVLVVAAMKNFKTRLE